MTDAWPLSSATPKLPDACALPVASPSIGIMAQRTNSAEMADLAALWLMRQQTVTLRYVGASATNGGKPRKKDQGDSVLVPWFNSDGETT
jgi:hypothetical protein